MADMIQFDSATTRFSLPLLFSGQAQKEAFVNEAHVLTDALLHCVAEAVADIPPSAPENGKCWLVGDAAQGEWTGQERSVAYRQQGQWIHITPRDGMAVWVRNTGQYQRYEGGWQVPVVPVLPTGGATIDVEARQAIHSIYDILRGVSILPRS